MGEAILNREGKHLFKALSAGRLPAGVVNPLTLEFLKTQDYDALGFRSKNWEELTVANALTYHFVLTVCNNATNKMCPVWPGQLMTVN